MRIIKYITMQLCLFLVSTSQAQINKIVPNDTIARFKVFGVCSLCKDRIEKAAKGRGVKTATWDIPTKECTVIYQPSQTSLEKIQRRIAAAGHDLANRKADDKVYNALPACCHYRELKDIPIDIPVDSMNRENEKPSENTAPGIKQHVVKGLVLETDKKGVFHPLAGASVLWLNAHTGMATDTAGFFQLEYTGYDNRLIISYTGYKSDTITVADMDELKIIMAADKQLSEVTVTSRRRSVYTSALDPLRTQVMTDKELFKAACCNLSESFETNPSVDVSYNDAVTGSKQIQLLGLSGIYTQLTVENLPGPRGIATPLGLNSIAGPWVESIQLTKGIGSVANGYESIAGQINVELKKPENSESFYANLYVNDLGKTEMNLNLAKKVGKKWSTGLLLHDDFLANRQLDNNQDGFRDLPTGNQFSMVNRWKYDDGKGLLTQFGLKLLYDTRTGGETGYEPGRDKYTTNKYGLGINTTRYELFGKIGYVFPGKKYKSFGLQLSAIQHEQGSYFGLSVYNAKEQNFYVNLIYQSVINSTQHKFRAGFSFLHDSYNEDFKQVNYTRKEIVPGAFFEYTWAPSEKFTMVAGIREDRNSLVVFFTTPRIHIRYAPFAGTTIRVSAGRGQRTANIFAENTAVFVSSRQVHIITDKIGKAYGLLSEVAWNKGISVDQKLKMFTRDALFSIDFFRNDFMNQVVADLETPGELRFYDLQGKSYSNSLQVQLDMEPVQKFDIRIAYRYFDVQSTYDGKLLQRPLTAGHRAFVNLAWSVKKFKFDYTANYNGKKRIPATQTNPFPYQRPQYAPGFMLMNAQVSCTIGKKHPMDIYAGAENMTGYYQKNAIIAADQPFSPYFDASLIWGPVTGRMFYAGWRFKIK